MDIVQKWCREIQCRRRIIIFYLSRGCMDIRIHVAKNFPNDYIHQYCTQRNKLSALEIAVFGGVKMNAQDFSFTCTAVDMAFTCYMKALLDTPTLTDFCNVAMTASRNVVSCFLCLLRSSASNSEFTIYTGIQYKQIILPLLGLNIIVVSAAVI